MNVRELKGKLDAIPSEYEVKLPDGSTIEDISADEDSETITLWVEDIPF